MWGCVTVTCRCTPEGLISGAHTSISNYSKSHTWLRSRCTKSYSVLSSFGMSVVSILCQVCVPEVGVSWHKTSFIQPRINMTLYELMSLCGLASAWESVHNEFCLSGALIRSGLLILWQNSFVIFNLGHFWPADLQKKNSAVAAALWCTYHLKMHDLGRKFRYVIPTRPEASRLLQSNNIKCQNTVSKKSTTLVSHVYSKTSF